MIVDQIMVGHGLIQLVSEIRLALFHLEDLVGAAVDILSRRGGQADQHGIEIVEHGGILPEDAAVRLVNDNQVEMAHGIQFLVRVDVIDHRLIGGENDAGVDILVFIALVAQHASGGVG